MNLRIVFNDDSIKEYQGVCVLFVGSNCREVVLNFPNTAVILKYYDIKAIEFIIK